MNRIETMAGIMAVAVGLSMSSVQPAAAQHDREVGIGYVANGPTQFLGGGAYLVVPVLNGLGVYIDAKTGLDWPSSQSNFRGDMTAADVRATYPDTRTRDEERWRSLNFGLVRPLTRELTIYAGGGYSHQTVFAEFEDPTLTRAERGLYWVEDADLSRTVGNFLVGGFFRVGTNVVVQLGFETAPRGMTIGARYVFGY